jgi:hypothetical protein
MLSFGIIYNGLIFVEFDHFCLFRFASHWFSVVFAINGRQMGDSGGCWLSSRERCGSFGEGCGSLRNCSGRLVNRRGSLGECSESSGEHCGSFGNRSGSLANDCRRLQSWLKRLPGRRKDLGLRRGKSGFWGQAALACATIHGATKRDSKTMGRCYANGPQGVSPSIAKSAPFFVHLFARRNAVFFTL